MVNAVCQRRCAQSQHLKGELRSLIRFYDFFCLFSSTGLAPLMVSRDLKCSERCSAEEIRELNVGGAMALLSCLLVYASPAQPSLSGSSEGGL